MANAIIGGLLSSGLNSGDIVVSDPSELARNHLQSIFKVRTTADNCSTVDEPGYVLVLAVKPQMMKVVAQGIAKMVEQFQPLIISIAAGITIPSLINWLTVGIASVPHIIRIMPNTPSLVNEGAAGLYAAANVNEEERELASELTKSVAKSLYWLEKESQIDAVTAISGIFSTYLGSGPAYFFLVVEAMEKAGVDLGLSPETARGLASQTCLGAGKMLIASSDSPSELRRKVTSPNGTTHAACVSLENGNIRTLFRDAIFAANDRGVELGKQLGGQV